jgi:outer membrane receptor for ferrienterochelin and colicin
MNVCLWAAAVSLMLATPAFAQSQQPSQAPPQQEQDPDAPVSFEEQVVVTASRTEQQLVNAPASVSLVTTETIQNSPATNIGDLLRAVPGVSTSPVAAPPRRCRPHSSPWSTAAASTSTSSAW